MINSKNINNKKMAEFGFTRGLALECCGGDNLALTVAMI